ncbi:DUF4376 domain-containing protein [Halocynthiibacter namhaensis]|uniref:DUF4376 domain-containing protein n=1 Tax=Halocynthiibacter namhaensis TaxID=1290553 RepID=UPI0005796823|nr:DUF4376 domain-containing protein [Halocynthiibacter namhaensis]
MLYYFFHSSKGMWAVVSEPTPDLLASYPEGTIALPGRPSDDHQWNDVAGEWQHVAPLVSGADIDAERNRRITAGFNFEGHIFQADPESLANITGATTSAIGALMAGKAGDDVNWADPATPFVWLAADNTLVPMGPAQVVAFGNAAMAHKSQHIHAARVLKNTNPIPANFADDNFWGAV